MLYHPAGSSQMTAFSIQVPDLPVRGGVDYVRDRGGNCSCGRCSRTSIDFRSYGSSEFVELDVRETTQAHVQLYHALDHRVGLHYAVAFRDTGTARNTAGRFSNSRTSELLDVGAPAVPQRDSCAATICRAYFLSLQSLSQMATTTPPLKAAIPLL